MCRKRHKKGIKVPTITLEFPCYIRWMVRKHIFVLVKKLVILNAYLYKHNKDFYTSKLFEISHKNFTSLNRFSNKSLIRINWCVQLKIWDYVPFHTLDFAAFFMCSRKRKISLISWCIEVVVAKRDQHLPYH